MWALVAPSPNFIIDPSSENVSTYQIYPARSQVSQFPMGVENIIPLEVLSIIIGNLLLPEGSSDSAPDVNLCDLRNARLVCRRWHSAASTRMFRNLALLHMPDGKDFTRFQQLVASPTVQHAARCVNIYSAPHHFPHHIGEAHSYGVWQKWQHNGYEEFTSAIDCIANLPKLQGVHIRFSDKSADDSEFQPPCEDGTEMFSTRLHTLTTVFKAIQTRAAREAENQDNPNTTVTSLTIQNLQNKPIPGFVTSDLFKSVAKDITELRLLVAEQRDESFIWDELDFEDRLTFEPWLQKSLLPLFANQLTSLHLAFNGYWGVAPGQFNGAGLLFPNLKALTLGKFTIGNHNHFDWVLAQKRLETLRLDRCVIVSYLSFENGKVDGIFYDQVREWNIPTHDWKQYPEWSFGVDEESTAFGFSGTWETIFDNIQAQLPNLTEFRMENRRPRKYGYFNSADLPNTIDYEAKNDRRYEDGYFNSVERMRCTLTPQRYITFDTWASWREWAVADELTGKMHFGNNNPAVLPIDERGQSWLQSKGELNRAKETLAGDSRALNALVRTVEQRRRQRGLDQSCAYL